MDEHPEDFAKLKKVIQTDDFIRYVFTNIDTSLASSDHRIMHEYAKLVEDTQLSHTYYKILENELICTRDLLMELLEKSIETRRYQHFYSNVLRASILDHLHLKQVTLLKKWRVEKALTTYQESNQTLLNLLLTINAIAGALRSTG